MVPLCLSNFFSSRFRVPPILGGCWHPFIHEKKRGEGRKRASHYFRWCICHGRPCRRYLSREWAAEFRDSLIIAARIGRSPYNWNGWHRLIRPWWRTWNASICDPSTHLSFRLMDSSTSFFSSSNSTQESQPTVDGRLFSLIAFPFAGVVLFFCFFLSRPVSRRSMSPSGGGSSLDAILPLGFFFAATSPCAERSHCDFVAWRT